MGVNFIYEIQRNKLNDWRNVMSDKTKQMCNEWSMSIMKVIRRKYAQCQRRILTVMY